MSDDLFEQPTTTTAWRIYDRAAEQWVYLRGAMTEAACRRHVEASPGRYSLVRVDVTETLTEVPL